MAMQSFLEYSLSPFMDALPIIFFVVFALVSIWFHYTQAQSIMERWARENGFQILEKKSAIFGGPFWLTKSRGQAVYEVVVLDCSGRRRHGWIKVGSFWFGMMAYSVAEHWDD